MSRVFGTALLLVTSGPALLYGQGTQGAPLGPRASSPEHLGTESPPLATQSDPEFKNVIVGGVFLGATWHDHRLIRTNPPGYGSDVRYFIQPTLALQATRRTVSWTIAATPGVSASRSTSDNLQYTQNLAGDFWWLPTARFNLHLRQDYSTSSNPFERVGRVPILPELNGYTGAGDGTIMLDYKRTALVSSADVSYRLTQHTALGIEGGYQRYDYGAGSSSFLRSGNTLPSHTYSGSAYYSWQFSRSQRVGVQYTVSDVYSGTSSRVKVHSTLLSDTWRLNQHTNLTIYAGPEFSHSSTLQILRLGSFAFAMPVTRDSISSTGGVILNWTGQRSAFQLNGVRRVSGSGGLMAASTMTRVDTGLRRSFSRRWSGDARASVSQQRALELFAGQGQIRSYWLGCGAVYQVSESLSLRMDYARIRQTGTGGAAELSNRYNLLQFALDWRFRKALGR